MKMTTEATSPVNCSTVDIKNCDLLAREGFAYCYSCDASGDTDCVYLFGGLIKNQPDSEEDYHETNELLVYKPSTGEVTVVNTTGDEMPSARSGSSLAIAGDRLFLFGGFNHSEAWLNDFWTFQLPSGPWRKAEFVVSRPSIGGSTTDTMETKPIVGTPLPTCRDKATLTTVTTASGTFLWLFGGFGPVPAGGIMEQPEDVEDDVEDGCPGEEGTTKPKPESDEEKQDPLRLTWFDDLYCINVTPTPDGLYDVKKPMQLNLDSPTPRAAHGATSFLAKNGNWNIAIFGGRDTDGRTNDLSIFDTKTRKWTAYDINDDGECDEEEEGGEVEGEEICEGEIEPTKKEEEKEESKEDDNGNIDESNKDDIAEQVKKNLEAIRKKTTQAELEKQEKMAVLQQPWPECRSYASVCVNQNRFLFMFGGRNEEDCQLNDMWMFDLENPLNGWYNLEEDKSKSSWPLPRGGAILVPMASTLPSEEQDGCCKMILVGGCADLQPESMHCSTLFTNGYQFNVNLTATLAMERKPVETKTTIPVDTDTAAMLKAAKKSVMAALKGDVIEDEDPEKISRKRSASPTLETLGEEHKNGNNETKRVRCGADD